MPSKKKKTQLQREYQKEYTRYLKRIKSAREAGYVIPDQLLKIKKEKPRTRDIETLKKITRKTIREKTLTGKVGFVNPETGEVLEKRQAFAKSYQRRKPRPNLEKPTTFNEAMDIVDVINEYINKYNPPESTKKQLIESFIEREMKSRRGSDFDYEKFKKAEEKNGWLFKDPNRPLDDEEIKYLQEQYDAGVREDPLGTAIEELRSWNPDFNFYDKYYDRQYEETGKFPSQIVNDRMQERIDKWDKEHNYPRFRSYEDVEQIEKPNKTIGEIPLETINLNNLRQRLDNVEIEGKYSSINKKNFVVEIGEQNKLNLNTFLDNAIRKYGSNTVDNAIAKANSEGKAFQTWFLYKGQAMGEYMSNIENILMDFGLDYNSAENYDDSFEIGDDYEEY